MKLFLFAVGGTGSRILKPLIMLCAAGVRPVGEDGLPIKDLEIVPIIMDPHRANEDLKRTDDMLRWYKEIRNRIYGDNTNVTDGFFSIKISSLSDIVKTTNQLNDTFIFNLSSMESKLFKDFISFNTMSTSNQALVSMLFSETQLMTKMDIGFVGSPNIGSVALNQFKDSEEFKQFANNFDKNDRIFIVSSIFGGTGAAGYPIIAKNIRNAMNNNSLAHGSNLSDSIIGALTVLPYFNITSDPKSPICAADFVMKTKSALEYYKDNLTGNSTINVCYYLGDEVMSNPYTNDPGINGQKNMAHFVEYVGALDIIHFLSIPDGRLSSSNGHANNPYYYEYGLRKDVNDNKMLTLRDFLDDEIVSIVNKHLIKFHLLYMYLNHAFAGHIGRGYTNDKPEITSSFLSTAFFRVLKENFLGDYEEWLVEMLNNKRQFAPFNLNTNDVAACINGFVPKTGLLGLGKVDYKTFLSMLNKESQEKVKDNCYSDGNLNQKLINLLDIVTTKICSEKFQMK